MKIEEVCAEYLNNISPLSRRVAEDVRSLNLNEAPYSKERLASIDKHLIQPQLTEKYKSAAEESPQLVPESNFSWFSKSQLNLFTAIDVKPTHSSTPNKVKLAQVMSPLRNAKDSSKAKAKVEDKPNKPSVKKPKTPPPPPPAKLVPVSQPSVPLGKQMPLSQSEDDIPKTGFDFLDNW